MEAFVLPWQPNGGKGKAIVMQQKLKKNLVRKDYVSKYSQVSCKLRVDPLFSPFVGNECSLSKIT